jgi:hypothetical protein
MARQSGCGRGYGRFSLDRRSITDGDDVRITIYKARVFWTWHMHAHFINYRRHPRLEHALGAHLLMITSTIGQSCRISCTCVTGLKPPVSTVEEDVATGLEGELSCGKCIR